MAAFLDQEGHWAEAIALHQAAAHAAHTLNSPDAEAHAVLDLGWVRRRTGDYPEAAQLAQRAYGRYHTLDNRQNEAWALLELGQISRETRNYVKAADLLERSRARFHELGDRKGEAEALAAAGDLQAATIGPGPALATYQQALTLARQINSPLDQAHALEGTANCHATLRHHREAVQSLAEEGTNHSTERSPEGCDGRVSTAVDVARVNSRS